MRFADPRCRGIIWESSGVRRAGILGRKSPCSHCLGIQAARRRIVELSTS